jgi:catechol 2,3-dioxygenase-like lactoylglutathione lyase family enzyme
MHMTTMTREDLQKYSSAHKPEPQRADEMPPVPDNPLWLTQEPDQDAPEIIWRTSMIKIRSVDQPRAVRWYRNVLGFKLEYDQPIKAPPTPFRMAVLTAPDNIRIEITGRGRPKKRPEDTWDTGIGITFQVKDLWPVREHLIKMGVEYFDKELNGQYGPLITLLDPDNNLINIQEPNERAWREHGLDNPHEVHYKEPRIVPD